MGFGVVDGGVVVSGLDGVVRERRGVGVRIVRIILVVCVD